MNFFDRVEIFKEIDDERQRQDAKWGVQNHPIRHEAHAEQYKRDAERAKRICDIQASKGDLTWFEILHEEFREVFAEDKASDQRAELIQVAAVAVSMIECIDGKKNTEALCR